MSKRWSRSAPRLLDGLAWGIDPAETLSILAARPEHAYLQAVLADVGRGQSLADALERRGAPPELVQAARVGARLSTPASAGLRTRAAMRSQADGRFALLSGLALPLASLVVALGVVWTTRAALAGLPAAAPPAWIEGGVLAAFGVGLVILVAVALPVVGRTLARLPGLGWIGRRRRAARLADMLALTLHADADPIAAAESLNAPGIARALRAGEALPAALVRSPDGRLLAPCLDGIDARRWPTALHDAAGRLVADVTERTGAWALTLRIGGTLVAAALIGFWLLWIYGAVAAVPGVMPT